jgi:hypothetical protein
METTHPSFPTLSSVQSETSGPKSSMSGNARYRRSCQKFSQATIFIPFPLNPSPGAKMGLWISPLKKVPDDRPGGGIWWGEISTWLDTPSPRGSIGIIGLAGKSRQNPDNKRVRGQNLDNKRVRAVVG